MILSLFYMFLSTGHPAASTEWGLWVCFGGHTGCLCGKCPETHLREPRVCVSAVRYKARGSGPDGSVYGRRICRGLRQPCVDSACEGTLQWKHWITCTSWVCKGGYWGCGEEVAGSNPLFLFFSGKRLCNKVRLNLSVQYKMHRATWHAVNPMITVNYFHVPEAWGSWTVLLRDSVPGAGTTQRFHIRLLLLSARCGSRQPEGPCGIGWYVYHSSSLLCQWQFHPSAVHVYF